MTTTIKPNEACLHVGKNGNVYKSVNPEWIRWCVVSDKRKTEWFKTLKEAIAFSNE